MMHVAFVVGCLWRTDIQRNRGKISRGFCTSWSKQISLSLSSWRGV